MKTYIYDVTHVEKQRILEMHKYATKNLYLIKESTTYIIKKGDVLSDIAQKYHTTPEKIAAKNKLSSINNIRVGQKIIIPSSSSSSPSSGYILVFAFPEYQPKVEDTWINRNIVVPISNAVFEQLGSNSDKKGKMIKMGKMGHGGCVVLDSKGNSTLYEFGRYENNKIGNVIKKNLGKIGKIKNGEFLNPKEVARIAKSRTEGQGPNLAMDVVEKELPNTTAAKEFADVRTREYTIADFTPGGAMNCGTYALEVAIAGGVDTSFKCFSTPIGVVEHLKPGLNTFTV